MNELPLVRRVEALEGKISAISTGLNAILMELAGIEEAKKAERERPYDISKINFVNRTGGKGPYLFADPKTESENSDFQALLQDLKDHGGRFRKDGYFMWIFQDSNGVGRKKLSKIEK